MTNTFMLRSSVVAALAILAWSTDARAQSPHEDTRRFNRRVALVVRLQP